MAHRSTDITPPRRKDASPSRSATTSPQSSHTHTCWRGTLWWRGFRGLGGATATAWKHPRRSWARGYAHPFERCRGPSGEDATTYRTQWSARAPVWLTWRIEDFGTSTCESPHPPRLRRRLHWSPAPDPAQTAYPAASGCAPTAASEINATFLPGAGKSTATHAPIDLLLSICCSSPPPTDSNKSINATPRPINSRRYRGRRRRHSSCGRTLLGQSRASGAT